jgi:hypothetical protein
LKLPLERDWMPYIDCHYAPLEIVLPKIPDEHFASIVTLSAPHRMSGALVAIGTAFLVRWKEDIVGPESVYLVTCAHCHPATEARFLTGETLALTSTSWIRDPNGNDLMALDVTDLLPEKISSSEIISLEVHIKAHQLEWGESRVGDEIYLLGLHVAEHGRAAEHPRARFGNISAWADDAIPVQQGNGAQKAAHIGDMRSRGGFSGSPVFTIRDTTDYNQSITPVLFGIHSDQFKERILIEVQGKSFYASIPTSMTIIVPAWHLSFIIGDKSFALLRENRQVSYKLGANK